MEFLTCNEFDRIVYQAVTDRAFRLIEERDDNLATRIGNAISKAFGG